MPLFKELAGSPLEWYDSEGMKAQRRLLCAYEDRHEVLVALLGDGYEFGGQAGAVYPGRRGVAAMRVRIEPLEKRPDNQGQFDDLAADLNRYSGQFVEITVDYELVAADGNEPQPPKPLPGTSLTYRMDFGGEYWLPPGEGLQWESDATIPVSPHAVPALRLPVTEHHVTWHRVVNPPWEAIRACVGAVNRGEFLGAAEETLLLDGAKADRVFAGLDELRQPQYAWRILYVFREKRAQSLQAADTPISGWNHAYRGDPLSPGWDRLVDAAGNRLYRAVDFAPLFAFGT